MEAVPLDVERLLTYFDQPPPLPGDEEQEWRAFFGRRDFQMTLRQMRKSQRRRAAPPWSFPVELHLMASDP
eukprot:3436819-Pyramimonas_sp.AAC.1